MDLDARLSTHGWYHTIEIGPGLATDGWFDLRPLVPRYGLPDDMRGLRALDIGTWDGFWAFEMERRGAQVVALDLDDERDLDWPPRRRPTVFPTSPRGAGFAIAKEMLGSAVDRVNMSIYHATVEELGAFDVVFCGSVLLHLRDQMLALERIAGLCRGLFISAEEYDRRLSLLRFAASRYLADREQAVVFWLPSDVAWRRMMWTAGFDRVERRGRFTISSRKGDVSVPHVVHHAYKR